MASDDIGFHLENDQLICTENRTTQSTPQSFGVPLFQGVGQFIHLY